MCRRIRSLLLLGLSLACRPQEKLSPLRVVTWNVHDLFDAQKDGDEAVVSPVAYESHLTAVATVLDELEADVVVLQEVESSRVLEDLAARAPGLAYTNRILVPGNDPRGINIGMLSRRAIDSFASHRLETFGAYGYHYARDCLELHLGAATRHVVLLGVHFKSKAPPDDPQKRLAEAEHTRAIADRLTLEDPLAGILVLGDFNDTPGSAPWRAVAGDDPDRYLDVAETLDAPFTYEHEGRRELLDHAMANGPLAALLDPGSVVILDTPAVRAASDHAPLAVSFELP
jgi:endonuclease/exonuclease/phosphatase family metal-dependent hydrolase